MTDGLRQALEGVPYDRLFVLVDINTEKHCWPLVSGDLPKAQLITIGATDENKTIDTLAYVWTLLGGEGGSRHSLLINLGGGMVTDLGGFAASTFKRGIKYINIPTTLLSMVDAAVGGKTGINFNGLKNEVGVFNPAETVIVNTRFLATLDSDNICSGYAEMLKHALISAQPTAHNLGGSDGVGAMLSELLAFDLLKPDLAHLQRMVEDSVAVKERIVREDPREKGIRKALNLGHTIGHAFESLALEEHRPVLHGYAVAWGLVCELYLSAALTGFPTDVLHQVTRFVRDNYGRLDFGCRHYDRLLEFMTHDKKNRGGEINFTLLGGVGDIRINQHASREDIESALDFLRES